MKQIKSALEVFVEKLKDTSEYKNYVRQKEKVKAHPELKAQIDEYRKMVFEVQSLADENEIYDKMEQFENEYAEFGEDPLVNDFLEAELALCRLVQEIEEVITDALNFE